MPVIVLVGLPSVGKSSLFNALSGKRLQHSGLTATTKDISAPVSAISDDGVSYELIDTPGLDDTPALNKLVMDKILIADVVFWATSVENCFITANEFKLYSQVENILKQDSIQNNKYHKYGIIITKCDTEYVKKSTVVKQETVAKKSSCVEITGDEESSSNDAIDRVYEKCGTTPVMIINAFNKSVYGSKQLMEFIKSKKVLTSDLYIKFNIKHLTDPELTRFELTFDHFMHLYLQIIPITTTTYDGYHNNSVQHNISQLNIHFKVQLEKIKAMTSNPNFTENYQRKLQEILTDDKLAPNVNLNKQLVAHYIYCKMPYYATNNWLYNAIFYIIARNTNDTKAMTYYQASGFVQTFTNLDNSMENVYYYNLPINRHMKRPENGTFTPDKLVASKKFVEEVLEARKEIYGEEPDLYVPGLLMLDNLLQRL